VQNMSTENNMNALSLLFYYRFTVMRGGGVRKVNRSHDVNVIGLLWFRFPSSSQCDSKQHVPDPLQKNDHQGIILPITITDLLKINLLLEIL